jgi:hypothetical protein
MYGLLIRTPPLTTVLFLLGGSCSNVFKDDVQLFSPPQLFSSWNPANKAFHPGEYPFSQELENEAKDSYLSKSPNYQYLAMCVYQMMEVRGAGEGCLSGIETVYTAVERVYLNQTPLRMKNTAMTRPNSFFYSRCFKNLRE